MSPVYDDLPDLRHVSVDDGRLLGEVGFDRDLFRDRDLEPAAGFLDERLNVDGLDDKSALARGRREPANQWEGTQGSCPFKLIGAPVAPTSRDASSPESFTGRDSTFQTGSGRAAGWP